MTEDEIKLKKALSLYSQGEIEDCVELSTDIYENTSDQFSKIQAISFLTSSINKVKDNKKLINLCNEGIQLSLNLKRRDILAINMALKAECLMYRCSVFDYKIRNLKMSLGWKGFALESEKTGYKILCTKKNECKKEAEKLTSKAVKIAESIEDKLILVKVLRSKATIYGEERMLLEMNRMRQSKMFLFFLNNFNLRLDFLLINKKEIEKITNTQRDTLLQAAELAKQLKNDQERAYILFNLVSEMIVAKREKEAKKYLTKAETLALRLNERILTRQAELLKNRIVNKQSKEELKRPPEFGNY